MSSDRTFQDYDRSQMSAVLLACGTCSRSYYTTRPVPAWVCIPCRHRAAKQAAEAEVLEGSDVATLEGRGAIPLAIGSCSDNLTVGESRTRSDDTSESITSSTKAAGMGAG